MSTVTFTGEKVMAALRRAPEIVSEVGAALQQGAVLIQREAMRLAPKADGPLFRNITFARLAALQYEVASRAPYAGYVEEGTGLYGPRHAALGLGMLPDSGVSAIAVWIARKGIVPRSPNVKPAELPWLIARKIARDGTKAQPYLAPAALSQTPRIRVLLDEAAARGLGRLGLA